MSQEMVTVVIGRSSLSNNVLDKIAQIKGVKCINANELDPADHDMIVAIQSFDEFDDSRGMGIFLEDIPKGRRYMLANYNEFHHECYACEELMTIDDDIQIYTA